MALFELKNLTKVYQNEEVKTVALGGVSFNIEAGEFVSIMGPSGSGKSTLLQILGFLDDPTDGVYNFNGKSWREYSRDDLAFVRNHNMGFVFQSFNLLGRTDVLHNVMLPLWYSDVPSSQWDKRARKAIDMVDLGHRLHHTPAQLSGGEKQRVAIARALVNDPDVIFADEPTGNLDSKNGQNVMDVLTRLHEEGGHTIILITHETDTARHAKRIISVKDGLVVSDTAVEARGKRPLRK
jgi:putative ABC transport system ATP-binding protein